MVSAERNKWLQFTLIFGDNIFPREFISATTLGDSYFVGQVGSEFLDKQRAFSGTRQYLPIGACIYALDGMLFSTKFGNVNSVDQGFNVMIQYLYSRPRTDYIYIEYFPSCDDLDLAKRVAVIFPLGQHTAVSKAWANARQGGGQNDRVAGIATGLFATLGALASTALTAPKPPARESIITGKGGCPMFTERHYDGMCW